MEAMKEMGEIIARHIKADGVEASSLPRVTLIRSSRVTEPMPTVYEPSLCIVVQGRKQAVVADRTYLYDAAKLLLVSVDLPVLGSVVEASPEQPYLCVSLGLDLPALSELMLDCGPAPAPAETPPPGIVLGEADPALFEALLRLLRLLDSPADAAVLAPLAEREILYRLLRGGQSAMVRHIATAESHLSRISRAIAWIKRRFREPMSVERLAIEAGMSPSSFHEHFRAVTGMSPLKFRTRLRLMEARRLMVSEGLDAATAGFRVGYESPSQFSRDYRSAFGAPPLRDVSRLRASAAYQMVA